MFNEESPREMWMNDYREWCAEQERENRERFKEVGE